MSENTLQVGDRIKFLSDFLEAKAGDVALIDKASGVAFRTTICRPEAFEGRLWVGDVWDGPNLEILPPLKVGDRVTVLTNDLLALIGDRYEAWRGGLAQVPVGTVVTVADTRIDDGRTDIKTVETFLLSGRTVDAPIWIPVGMLGDVLPQEPDAVTLKVGGRYKVVRPLINFNVGEVFTVVKHHESHPIAWGTDISRAHGEENRAWIWDDQTYALEAILEEVPAAEGPLVEVGTRLRCVRSIGEYHSGEVVTLVKKHWRINGCWGTDKLCPGNEDDRWWFFEDYITDGRFEVVAEEAPVVAEEAEFIPPAPALVLEVGKVYDTREGGTARVICVDRESEEPVIALVRDIDNPEYEENLAFRSDGYFYPNVPFQRESPFDLIREHVPPREAAVVYVPYFKGRTDPWGGAYAVEKHARHSNPTSIHRFIEDLSYNPES